MKQQTDHVPDVRKKLTAIDWLVKELNLEGYDYTIEQAKAMEKEQIVEAHYQGYRNFIDTTEISEQYYNKTYGK